MNVLNRCLYTTLLTYAASGSSQNLPVAYQKILDATKKYSPNQTVPVVSDALSYARNLSLRPDVENSFHVVDVCNLADRMQLWNKYLPNIPVYYAVKSNHSEAIASGLASLGAGFDCASIGEMKQALNLGVSPEKIIFSHPRKPINEIVFAEQHHIKKMVFDSIEELKKMQRYAPSGEYILRIKTHDEHSTTPLSAKFGASIDDARKILDYAYKNKAAVVGISFHVGSNNKDANAFTQALQDASQLFKYSQDKWHHTLSLLDLGGGWPGNNDKLFIEFAKTVNKDLKTYFSEDVRVIAEPGRYFATQTTTIVLRVIGTEERDTPKGKEYAYFLSNGVYGSFLSSLYYHYDAKKLAIEDWEFHPLTPGNKATQDKLFPSIFWGPTCDSGDKILDNIAFPKLKLNDFIYTQNAGAYTYSTQTAFNQITPSKAYYICGFKPKV